MNKTNYVTIIAIILAILALGTSIARKNKKIIEPIAVISSDTIATKEYVRKSDDQLGEYLHALSLLESNGDPSARREGSQYIGSYQIGNSARSVVGLSKLNTESNYQVMLNDSFLQEMIMLRLLQANVVEMKSYFTKYNGTKVFGWYVSNSGILAMTHLMGGGNTKAFLEKGTITKDGNNRPITDYLQLNNFNILIDSIATGGYIKNVLSKVVIK